MRRRVTDSTQGESCMTVEAQIGAMCPQAKEGQGLRAALKAKRKAWNTSFLRALRESTALLTP